MFSIYYESLADIHENVFAANLNGVAIHAHCRVLANLAGGHIVLPAVPWTGYDVPVHHALAQGTAPMQAGIVDGIELAAYIGKGNGFALDLKLADRSRR